MTAGTSPVATTSGSIVAPVIARRLKLSVDDCKALSLLREREGLVLLSSLGVLARLVGSLSVEKVRSDNFAVLCSSQPLAT